MLKTHTITQGDAFFVELPLTVPALRGTPWPVQGWSWWWTVKSKKSDPDSAALIRKTSAAGQIRYLDSTRMYVEGLPADTNTAAPGKYFIQTRAKSPAGDPFTTEDAYLVINPKLNDLP